MTSDPPLDPAFAAARILEHLDAGLGVAVVVRLPTDLRRVDAGDGDPPGTAGGPEAQRVGDAWSGRLLVPTDGPVQGTLGAPDLDRRAVELARDALERGAPEGVHSLARSDGSETEVYVELHAPAPELVIVGAGHIAQPLASLGTMLGFRVAVLDDRPDFATAERFPEAARVARVDFANPFRDVAIGSRTHVVLVTRGHKYDYECLRRILAGDPLPAYLGMIGSRRRVRATFVQLLDEGVPRERLARVRAPVGLDLRAQTPAEIAVSVAAEIVASRRDGTGQPLAERERILERFFPE